MDEIAAELVQLAKHFGARVTGVCSTKNLELVTSLGADAVIDYTKDDFSKTGRVYDVVFDTVGKSGYLRSLRSLKRGGFYVRVGGSGALSSILVSILAGAWMSLTGAARFVGGVAAGGREAHRYVEAGHKRGNVVIVV